MNSFSEKIGRDERPLRGRGLENGGVVADPLEYLTVQSCHLGLQAPDQPEFMTDEVGPTRSA